MAQLIDGRALASSIRARLPARVQRLARRPGLGVVLVGHDPASEVYVKLKGQAAEAAGIHFVLERLPEDATTSSVTGIIDRLNVDPEIDAILVQLPLPPQLREKDAVDRIDPEKDVDGFHPVNTGRYLTGERTDPPSLVDGILRLLKSTGVSIDGLMAVIIARETVFAQCLEHALALEGVLARTVPADGNHRAATLESDIVIVAAGKPKLVVGEDLKPGSLVVDVGINRLPEGMIVGDADVDSVSRVAGWLTPVPGGVGPMTIATLLENTVRLAEKNQA